MKGLGIGGGTIKGNGCAVSHTGSCSKTSAAEAAGSSSRGSSNCRQQQQQNAQQQRQL
jgi:hypothetical protein